MTLSWKPSRLSKDRVEAVVLRQVVLAIMDLITAARNIADRAAPITAVQAGQNIVALDLITAAQSIVLRNIRAVHIALLVRRTAMTELRISNGSSPS